MSLIDRYLDEMFDRLAGTGAAARGALAEIEDHLRTAVAEAMAKRIPREQAEHEAVTRFGPPARIARQWRRANRRGWLMRGLSGAWLLAGLALVMLGVSFLATALAVALMPRTHPVPGCNVFLAHGCYASTASMRDVAIGGAVVFLAGLLALAGRRLARRRAGLAPAPRRFPLVAAPLLVVLGLAVLAVGRPGAGFLFVPHGPGPGIGVITAAVTGMGAIAIAAWGAAASRRPRYQR
jgi:hypothetical protein